MERSRSAARYEATGFRIACQFGCLTNRVAGVEQEDGNASWCEFAFESARKLIRTVSLDRARRSSMEHDKARTFGASHGWQNLSDSPVSAKAGMVFAVDDRNG